MTRTWVAIQRNPNSGTGRKKARILGLIQALRRHGIRPRLYSRREQLDEQLRTEAGREGLLCIVAAGGDGTIADVVNRFPGITVCPFPLGTENVLCKYLRITDDGEMVAEMIVRHHWREFDLGQINGRRFTMMASAGFDGDVVHRVHQARRGNITKLAYMKPLWQTTFTYKFPLARVFFDDDPQPVSGSLVMVANLPCYGMGLRIVPHANGNDGLLDVGVFPEPGSMNLIGYGFDVLAGRQVQPGHDAVFRQARKIRLESDSPVPVQIDGDPLGMTPCDIEVVPNAMRLIVP